MTSFGNGGIAVANLPTVDPTTGLKTNFNGMVGAIAVQPDGKILVTGGKAYTSANAVGDFITVRFNTNGTLDNTFGTKGISEIPFSIGGANTDVGEGIAIQPDGKIVIGGEVQSGGDFFGSPVYPTYIFGAARLTTNGALDTTFGTGGKQTYSINNPAGVGDLVGVHSVNFSTGGKIILVGNDSQRVAIIQLTNNTTFNPLPPPPAPATGLPPPVASPGTTVSEFAASGDGTRLTTYQGTKPPDYQYDPTQASNLTVLPTVQMLTDGFNGVIRSAIGDVDGNGVPDIIVVTGPGTPTRWAVINGSDPQEFLIPPLPAFTGSEMFSGGAYVSVGDFDNDGKDEIVLSADQGGGPRITIFSFNAATPPAPTVDANFYGIADPNFRGGTRTAVGDLNGDGVPDLAVATGNGGGPRIALYDGTSLFTTQTKLINDFYAFDSSLRDGAYVAIGDVNGDGFGDLVFGAGDGGAPQVLVINGQKALSNLTAALAAPIESFFVNGDSTDRGGVRVAVKDVDADNKADIITGSGVYQQSQINVYLGSQLSIGDTTAEQTLDPFATILPNGIYVG
ncbi:MAG TPA: FG-GAP-like repeat-containing protein [Urbifossiella sp.]